MEPTPSHPSTADRRASATASVWRPLRGQTFRDLLIADIFSDVGTFMQSVGAAWLMVSLKAGPMYVALTQTASALPFFLFALPAGALGDICDRRKLILFTEIWMAFVAVALAVLVITGFISPWLLARPHVCVVSRRCIRDTDVAGCFARAGRDRGFRGSIRAQRN